MKKFRRKREKKKKKTKYAKWWSKTKIKDKKTNKTRYIDKIHIAYKDSRTKKRQNDGIRQRQKMKDKEHRLYKHKTHITDKEQKQRDKIKWISETY